MRAIILAAGRGSRLKDFTSDKPKCMVELKGKPLIDYQVKALTSSGITDIAVVSGYLKEKIIHPKITKFFENKNWHKTNMVSSLFEADEWLKEHDCIVSYSDIFYEDSVIQKLITSTEDISITYDKNFAKLWGDRFSDPLDDLESFKIDSESYLIEIGKKASNISEIEGQYMGLLKFTPYGWKRIKNVLKNHTIENLDMTTMLNLLIQEGIEIRAIAITDNWGEIDNISDLELYENN
jgi:L-glutamine-phosphate cytidylyltransferase